jgi:hypothetical protein
MTSWWDWFTSAPGKPVALGWGSTPDPSWQNAGMNAFEKPDEFDRVREGLPPDHPMHTPPAQRAGRAVDYNFVEGKGDRLDIKPSPEGFAPLSGWELEQPRTAQVAREGKRLDGPSLIERINPSLEYQKDLNTTVAPKSVEPFSLTPLMPGVTAMEPQQQSRDPYNLNPVVRGTVVDAEWEPMTGVRRNAPSQLRRGLQALPEALKATNFVPAAGQFALGAAESLGRSVTAPYRAMNGEIHPDDMFNEATEFALNLGGWGGVAHGLAGTGSKAMLGMNAPFAAAERAGATAAPRQRLVSSMYDPANKRNIIGDAADTHGTLAAKNYDVMGHPDDMGFTNSITGERMGRTDAMSWLKENDPATFEAYGPYANSGRLEAQKYNRAFEKASSTIQPTDDINAFMRAANEVRETKKYGPVLGPVTPEYLEGARMFMSADGKTGFAIKPDGDMINTFSLEKGRLPTIMDAAIKGGAKKLDTLDTGLPERYAQYGFEEVGRAKWDDNLAPMGWNKEALGTPDNVYMQHRPRLEGLPEKTSIPGRGEFKVGPSPRIRAVARSYTKNRGMDYDPPKDYRPVDPVQARQVADEYGKLKHDPSDPDVQRSYGALINETRAQWDEIEKSGLKVEFMKPGPDGKFVDPYAKSPRLAIEDIEKNNHLWVFPTKAGYGHKGSGVGDARPMSHPMLGDSGVVIDGHPLVHNDLFRIVHDYFGHGKEGVGFRATGEDNAFRQHRSMYSKDAQRALTTETRGQNSEVNFGPHAEKNKGASGADTIYADQKAALMPEWTTLYANSKKTAPLGLAGAVGGESNVVPFPTRGGGKGGGTPKSDFDFQASANAQEAAARQGVDLDTPEGQDFFRRVYDGSKRQNQIDEDVGLLRQALNSRDPTTQARLSEAWGSLSPKDQATLGRYLDQSPEPPTTPTPKKNNVVSLFANNKRAAPLGLAGGVSERNIPGSDWYHGTTHDFDKFDLSKADPEGHMGRGVYATSNPMDAGYNYARPDGADLRVKIERRADQIVSDNEGTSLDDAMDMAEAEMVGPAVGRVRKLKIKDKGVLRVDTDHIDLYDPNIYNKFTKAVRGAVASHTDKYGWASETLDADDLIAAATKNGDTDVKYIDRALRERLDEKSPTNDEGTIVSYDILKDIYKRMGYTGVEINAARTFPGMQGMQAGTRHRTMFKKGTVRDAKTGSTLYANSKKAAPLGAVGALSSRESKWVEKGMTPEQAQIMSVAAEKSPSKEFRPENVPFNFPGITPGDTRISTRVPQQFTEKGNKRDWVPDAHNEHLSVDTKTMSTMPSFEHNISLLGDYPGFERLRGMPAQEAADQYINQTVGNTLHMMSRLPDEVAKRSPKWYEGAQRVSGAFSDKWGVARHKVSAAIAALSPQKDWFQNASLAQRIGDIMFGDASSKAATKEMIKWAKTAKKSNTDDLLFDKPEDRALIKKIEGKRFDELDDDKARAMWVRAYDEAHNKRYYREITPEGEVGPWSMGEAGQAKISWGSQNEIEKAVRALRAGDDPREISSILSDTHKVRSFYNNIENPHDARFGDATIDTHQVGGSQLRSVSQKDPAVLHNFALSPMAKNRPAGFRATASAGSGDTGIHGTYPLLNDTLRQAGDILGVLPREVQSPTWEGTRLRFPRELKGKGFDPDHIWGQYDRGEITLDQARDLIVPEGSIPLPSYAQPGYQSMDPRLRSTYSNPVSAAPFGLVPPSEDRR